MQSRGAAVYVNFGGIFFQISIRNACLHALFLCLIVGYSFLIILNYFVEFKKKVILNTSES